eukprot:212783-Chlamydomonas_euryale.AAC.3
MVPACMALACMAHACMALAYMAHASSLLPRRLGDARQQPGVRQLPQHDAGHACKAVHAARPARQHAAVLHAVGRGVARHGPAAPAAHSGRASAPGTPRAPPRAPPPPGAAGGRAGSAGCPARAPTEAGGSTWRRETPPPAGNGLKQGEPQGTGETVGRPLAGRSEISGAVTGRKGRRVSGEWPSIASLLPVRLLTRGGVAAVRPSKMDGSIVAGDEVQAQ